MQCLHSAESNIMLCFQVLFEIASVYSNRAMLLLQLHKLLVNNGTYTILCCLSWIKNRLNIRIKWVVASHGIKLKW